jgi:RNA recognition motif-containing protein
MRGEFRVGCGSALTGMTCPLVGSSMADVTHTFEVRFQMQNKLFVRNLSFSCEDRELGQLFTEFGEVTSAKIAVDRDTGRGRGFGFVEMSTQQQAEDAIRGLNGRELGGRAIQVAMSEPREKQVGGNRNDRW